MTETTEKTTKTFATLVRGNVYLLGDKMFEAGIPQEVTAEEKAILERDAFDPISVEGETLHRAKFTFAASDAAEDAEIVSGEAQSRPRTRAR
jgi:hypothetical protein